ncbi:MAG: BTAD domain-containing putative transcriptional regulator, partial [Elusimicrobiota bacterium]
KHPKDERARAWLGRTRLAGGDAEGARRDLARAGARAWHGEALAMLGRHQEAELEFSAALAEEPEHAEVLAQRGQSRLALGRAAAALLDLRAAAEREPRAAWIHAAHSEAALAAGRKAEAAAAFVRARGLAPSDLEKRARRLSEAGRHEEAATLCTRALLFEPRGRELRALRAEAYRCLHRHDEAVADHDRLVALSKKDPEALLSRGAARRAARDYAGALDDARAARRKRSASALILEAEALRNLGREREARAVAAHACALEPRRAWAWVVRAKAALQDGDPLAARGYCDRALRLDTTDAKALGWRAWVNIRLGAPKRARSDARRTGVEP